MLAISIGKTTYDITIPVDAYPVENSKAIINEKLEGSGGSASNVAYLLGRWGIDTYFMGTIGYDDMGTNIKKELESVKVHTNFMEVNYEKKTTTTFIIANKETTSRTQLMIEPEKFHLKRYEFDVSPSLIYTDGYEYSAALAAINKSPNAITMLGAGLNHSDEKEIVALAKYVKYIVFSLEFACKVTKMRVDFAQPVTLLNLYKEIKEKFPNSINIITLHNMGVLYSINNEVKIMPTIEVKEVDRTGAGDIFDGTLLYALGKGYDLEKGLRLANIAGALSTLKYGAKNSIPLISDVIQHYEQRFGPLDVVPTQNNTPSANVETNVTTSQVSTASNEQSSGVS